MTSASHAAHAVTPARVTALSAQVAQVVIVLQLPVAHAPRALPWAPTPRQLMAATSRLKQLGLYPVATSRNPPLSASAKPRQLQQLTVPRLSNQSEQRRI